MASNVKHLKIITTKQTFTLSVRTTKILLRKIKEYLKEMNVLNQETTYF